MIDYDTKASQADLKMIHDHGWEISEDETKARLYSEEWSSIQVAIFSAKWWIQENAI